MLDYIIIILSPVMYAVSFISIRYIIVEEQLRKHHSKTYMRKNKKSFFNHYFLWSYKSEIKKIYYFVYVYLALLLLAGTIVAIIYIIFCIIGYKTESTLIIYSCVFTDIVLAVAREIRQIYTKFFKAK